MLIGISGKKNSGKDKTFEYLHEIYPLATNVKFAGRLKEIVAVLADVNVSNCYAREEKETMRILHLGGRTLREIQQDIGMAFRQMYGEDVWVNIALRNRPKYAIVTDVRFPNEAAAIREAGGILIRVNRPMKREEKEHESETALDDYAQFDHVIENNGTLDDLRMQVVNIFK
jgi:uncharacterized membrane protein